MRKILRGDSACPNNELFSENAWSKIKSKDSGASVNLVHVNEKNLFLLRIIGIKMTLISCKCYMGEEGKYVCKILPQLMLTICRSGYTTVNRCRYVSEDVVSY